MSILRARKQVTFQLERLGVFTALALSVACAGVPAQSGETLGDPPESERAHDQQGTVEIAGADSQSDGLPSATETDAQQTGVPEVRARDVGTAPVADMQSDDLRSLESNSPLLEQVARCAVLFDATSDTPADSSELPGDSLTLPTREFSFDDEYFLHVWGSDDGDVWVLGERGLDEHGEEARAAVDCDAARHDASVVARRLDGDRFVEVEFPASSKIYDLHGSAADDVWAVGAHALAWHFDGARWQSFDLSAVLDLQAGAEPCSEVVLTSVWARAPNDVWSVGYSRSAHSLQGVALHYDGAVWTREDVSVAEPLHAVWAADSNQVWAVGARGAMFQRVGGEWSRLPSLTESDLTSVSGASADSVWVAGNTGTMLRFDGERWQAGALADDYTFSQGITARPNAGVWMLNSTVTREGYDVKYEQSLVHWNGSAWCSLGETSDTSRMLSEVWVGARGQVWAAGHAILRLL